MIIGLDLGTTSAKAVALAPDGSVSAARRSVYPAGPEGRARQEPEAVLSSALTALGGVVADLGASAVRGIALSAAMHTLVATDEEGAVLGGVSTWGDAPSAALGNGDGSRARLAALYDSTGCPPSPVYVPARLPWLRRQDAILRERLAGLQTFKERVFQRLTGRNWIDVVTASTTGLLDIHQARWAPQALAVAGLDAGQLPDLVACTASAELLRPVAAQLGLGRSVPVVVGAPDGPLVNLALGADNPGDATLSMGTTAAVRLVTRTPWTDPRRRTWCYRFHPGGFLVGGAINNAGLLLDWARRVLYAGVETEAGFLLLFGGDVRTVPPGADGVTMRPFLVPERDPGPTPSSASFDGVLERHGRAHLARAVLDAVALSLSGLADTVLESGRANGRIALAGIPAQYPAVAQIICDCLGRPLRVVRLADASAVGAALIGYEALGVRRPSTQRDSWWLAPDPAAAGAYGELRRAAMTSTPGAALRA